MQSETEMFTSLFEREGEEQVRLKAGRGDYGVRGLSVAVDWLDKKSAAREAHAREIRLLGERQARAAEIANQLSERQATMAESANQLARDANRLSKWAILISVLSCILAVVTVLYDHS